MKPSGLTGRSLFISIFHELWAILKIQPGAHFKRAQINCRFVLLDVFNTLQKKTANPHE